MKAQVYVRLKTEVSDPAGMAIREALATQHYKAVTSVRVGRVFDLELDEKDAGAAKVAIEKIAHEILSNPVIEEFSYEIAKENGK